MEVKDFEGAVKMQGAMMDKLASSRLFRITMKKQTNKQANKQPRGLPFLTSFSISCFVLFFTLSVLSLKGIARRERGEGEEDDGNSTRYA